MVLRGRAVVHVMVLHGFTIWGAGWMQAAGRYTRVAVVLHWVIAVLIIGNVVVGLVADSLPDGMIRPAVDLHKSIGLTVLGLAVLRVLWRVTHRPPPLPRAYPMVERVGAHVAHVLLYVLILGLPLSGWVHDSAFKDAAAHPLTIFGLPWFRIGPIMNLPAAEKEQVHATWFAVHVWMGYALYGLLALHVLGALKHQFIDREAEFSRMSLRGRFCWTEIPGSSPGMTSLLVRDRASGRPGRSR